MPPAGPPRPPPAPNTHRIALTLSWARCSLVSIRPMSVFRSTRSGVQAGACWGAARNESGRRLVLPSICVPDGKRVRLPRRLRLEIQPALRAVGHGRVVAEVGTEAHRSGERVAV